jgi:putative transcriptional regulator
MDVPRPGRLLVAGPRLIDPNFWRTVVLLCATGDDGALGLILNRPSDVAVGDHLPGWVERLTAPEVVFVGGPVEPDVAVGLGRRIVDEPHGWSEVEEGVGMVDLTGRPGEAAGDLDRLRVFAGYAGWGPGQLETEMAAGDWVLAPGGAEDAFTAEPASLWRRVLRRQGGRAAMYAHFPLDPGAN